MALVHMQRVAKTAYKFMASVFTYRIVDLDFQVLARAAPHGAIKREKG